MEFALTLAGWLLAGFVVAVVVVRYDAFDQGGTADNAFNVLICLVLWPLLALGGAVWLVAQIVTALVERVAGRQ